MGAVICGVSNVRFRNLALATCAFYTIGLLLSLCQRGQKHGCKYANDRNDHKQFNQGESLLCCFFHDIPCRLVYELFFDSGHVGLVFVRWSATLVTLVSLIMITIAKVFFKLQSCM